jgi:hypothetical protein
MGTDLDKAERQFTWAEEETEKGSPEKRLLRQNTAYTMAVAHLAKIIIKQNSEVIALLESIKEEIRKLDWISKVIKTEDKQE